MQEQLLEREQAILNKEKTIQNSIDTEKALENYRSILREKIIWLKKNKDRIIKDTIAKENSLAKMFQELVRETKLNQEFIGENHKLVANKFKFLIEIQNIKKNEMLLVKKRQLIYDRLEHLISKYQYKRKSNNKENKEKNLNKKKLDKSVKVEDFEGI
jgi:hypothetical protein